MYAYDNNTIQTIKKITHKEKVTAGKQHENWNIQISIYNTVIITFMIMHSAFEKRLNFIWCPLRLLNKCLSINSFGEDDWQISSS